MRNSKLSTGLTLIGVIILFILFGGCSNDNSGNSTGSDPRIIDPGSSIDANNPYVADYDHEEFRGDCLSETFSTTEDSNYMYVEVIENDLHVHHMYAYYQCCLGYRVLYSLPAPNSITGREIDVGGLCDCYCDFNLESVIYDLDDGEYIVTLIGIELDTIGVDTVTVDWR
ncbi:MAG: hypothetical protein GY855_12750 [candidate division Zixibacteria bacterium]|nr:hypothetical protein [candidate division Zixibacteria bacterium]